MTVLKDESSMLLIFPNQIFQKSLRIKILKLWKKTKTPTIYDQMGLVQSEFEKMWRILLF